MTILNKIGAAPKTIKQILENQKYTVDYFQREYKWERKHIETLINDLSHSFLNEYNEEHARKEVENYASYFLGSCIVYEKEGQRSIVDGQQRLTSLTLLLIYLYHLQNNSTLSNCIFSEKYGEKSFNLAVDEREQALKALFIHQQYKPKEQDSPSVHNMAERYEDIEELFPEELKNTKLPYFVDWLLEKVTIIEITAYSEDNAYAMFEGMNDRGLSLSASEMLKGFLLMRISGSLRHKAEQSWKNTINQINTLGKDEDLRFFQAWLRGIYAESIRENKAGSVNQDFENIGTRFHSWMRDNLDKCKLNQEDDFYNFVCEHLPFYGKAYQQIVEAGKIFSLNLAHVYYIHQIGIAPTLSLPIMLAPLLPNDDETVMQAKINCVAAYLEQYLVRRFVNNKAITQTTLRHTIYTLLKEIRACDLPTLQQKLNQAIQELDYDFSGILKFRLHGQNKRLVKFLLARLSAWVDNQVGAGTSFQDYYQPTQGKPFEIEHILANHFERHQHEFDDKEQFDWERNRLGALILLPNGRNQSYNDLPYEEKLKHYIKENTLAQSLHPLTYENNPSFLKLCEILPFQEHKTFQKQDIQIRQTLYRAICEHIWQNVPQ